MSKVKFDSSVSLKQKSYTLIQLRKRIKISLSVMEVKFLRRKKKFVVNKVLLIITGVRVPDKFGYPMFGSGFGRNPK